MAIGPNPKDTAILFLFEAADLDVAMAASPGRQPTYIRDHRKRLSLRFLEGGAAAMPDYELLELMLFRALPRQDVKQLAQRLLEKFGNFNHFLSASVHQLSARQGVGDTVICELKIVEATTHRLAQSRVVQRPMVSGSDALLDYCRSTMAHPETEQFLIFYLDLKNVLIADELQATGTIDHVPVYPREVVKRALELNVTAFILLHNHPSGPAHQRLILW